MSNSSARKLRRMSGGPQDAKVERKRVALVVGIFMLLAARPYFLCSPSPIPYPAPSS